MAHKEMICIACPMGCCLDVEYDNSIISVKSNSCKVGIKYANDEIYDPRRMVTTTVKTNLAIAFLPVKTSKAISKNLVRNVIKELNDITVSSPVQIGSVIKKNICGTDADIIAARNIS